MRGMKLFSAWTMLILCFWGGEAINAQSFQVQTSFVYRRSMLEVPEIQKISTMDSILIVDAHFTKSILCNVTNGTIQFEYPFEDSTEVLILLSHNGLHFYTNTITLNERYLQDDGNIWLFEWMDMRDEDIDDEDIDKTVDSDWNHYFSVIFEHLPSLGDPAMAEPIFITDRMYYFKNGDFLFQKCQKLIDNR